MKKTKIICSIGPSSCNVDVMREMVLSGMNVARINFSHATIKEREDVVSTVKKVRSLTNVPVAILYDTKGPEFRNGELENGEITLVKDETIRIVKEEVLGNNKRFSVNHSSALDSINVGDIILLENGLMKIEVISKEEDGITCLIINGGVLGNKKSLSVPGVKLDIPFVSKEDLEDITYACNHDASFLALSFVSSKDDVLEVKEILKNNNREDLKIISKIESATGIENLDEIIEVSDGIMVARGDLGVEIPMEELPHTQKLIISRCRHFGKICIVATEMLESMKKNIRPTRAEVSDIAYAVMSGADAVMLSGETTTGKYPIETVSSMAMVCESAEKYVKSEVNRNNINKDIASAIAASVIDTSDIMDAKLIVAATMSGHTAKIISNLRPKSLVLATCPSDEVARSLMLNYAVYPAVTNIYKNTDEIIFDAKEKAKENFKIEKDDILVITGGFPNNSKNKITNFMKIEKM